MGIKEDFEALIAREQAKGNKSGAYALDLQQKAVLAVMREFRVPDLLAGETETSFEKAPPIEPTSAPQDDFRAWPGSPIKFSPSRDLILYSGEPRQLSPMQSRLFGVIADNAERVVRRNSIARAVWGIDDFYLVNERYRRLLLKLRGRVEPSRDQSVHIHSIPSEGLLFTPLPDRNGGMNR